MTNFNASRQRTRQVLAPMSGGDLESHRPIWSRPGALLRAR